MSSRIDQAIALLKSIATGDIAPSSVIHPERYIQHNLAAPDGLMGFFGLQKLVSSAPGSRIETLRGFEDGDYVFLHTHYVFFGRDIVGFDIFRFEGAKVVEHWDNLHKALVRDFIETALIGKTFGALERFFTSDAYIQHNPGVADGVSGFIEAAKTLAAVGKAPQYSKVHLVLGDGNFVLVVSEGSVAGTLSAFFDLFRIENGKIAEHWDTVDAIPARDTWKNANGKF